LLDTSHWFWLHGKVTGYGDMAKSLVLAMFMHSGGGRRKF